MTGEDATTAALPEAHSVDGRRFSGDVPLGVPLLPGDFVLLDVPGDGCLLGQVLHREPPGGPSPTWGALRAAVAADGAMEQVEPRPFAGARVRLAPGESVVAYQRWAGADMAVGTTSSGHGASWPALLRRKGFGRHTFLCGQSGSGKTYALGVLLEALLSETELPIVVVDPNADYVGLGRVRSDAAADRAARLGDPEVRVLRAEAPSVPADAERLHVTFADMSPAAKAATLRVDPLRDREEYNDLLRVLDGSTDRQELAGLLAHLEAADGTMTRAVVQRLQNLGVLRWDLWSRGRTSLLDVLAQAPRATVLDVSGCRTPPERSAAALALLDHLWAHRDERRPVLVVIDEAHNLCTPAPVDEVQAAVTERLVQIAAEGRKYGLWLLLSTQQPHKIHPNVLSQCDNLVLMRMSSAADLAHLGEVFGAAPPQMLATATAFRQGEMLLAGGFVAAPMIARVAQRLTVEGGGDVAVPLRA